MVEPALLDRLTIGDHVCWAVDDDRVRLHTVAAFVRQGLREHHQVLYSGAEPEALLEGLDELGIDTSAAQMSGQLSASTPEESYLAGGVFDAPAVLGIWPGLAAAARRAGYRGLRVLGDMTWAAGDVPGREQLAWYESQVNRIMLANEVLGVCMYDTRIFDPLELRRLIWQHPVTVATDTPYDERLSLRVRRTRDPLGLHFSGEVDLSNRGAFRSALDHLFEDAGADSVTVDVSDLRFADRAAARALVRAGSGAGKLRLVGASPALIKLLAFSGSATAPGLTIAEDARG